MYYTRIMKMEYWWNHLVELYRGNCSLIGLKDQYLFGREHLVSFYWCYIQILVLGAQGIHATGFKRA